MEDSANIAPPPKPESPLRSALLALTALNQDLALLEYGNILIRRDYVNLQSVLLVSGGKADPDLTIGQLVGKGLLTAAVYDQTTMPNSREIARFLKELILKDFSNGIILLVPKRGGTFSFSLAVNRLSNCALRLKLIPLQNDDFVLTVKILGAMAEKGATYDEILTCYNEQLCGMKSIGFDFAPETKRIELCADAEVEDFVDNNKIRPLAMIVLVNVTKTMDRMEQLDVVKQLIDIITHLDGYIIRLYLMSCFKPTQNFGNMTVLHVEDSRVVEALDAPYPGWHPRPFTLPLVTPQNILPSRLRKSAEGQRASPKGPTLGTELSKVASTALEFACNALVSCEKQLNAIDLERSTGNVGTRLKIASQEITRRILAGTLVLDCPYALLKTLSVVVESAAGGAMGSVYGVVFETASEVFGEVPETEVITGELWFKALTRISEALMNQTENVRTENTMCYPIMACQIALKREMKCNESMVESFAVGVAAAEEAAQETRESNGEHPDAGAHAVGIWMRAIFEAVRLKLPK